LRVIIVRMEKHVRFLISCTSTGTCKARLMHRPSSKWSVYYRKFSKSQETVPLSYTAGIVYKRPSSVHIMRTIFL